MTKLLDQSTRKFRAVLTQVCIILGAGGFAVTAAAHGGVSIEDDVCLLQLGRYRLHFTGYQPAQSGAEEFCEDIPVTGTAIVVLDVIDDALRDMPIELSILRDTAEIGNSAKVADLGDSAQIEAATIARLPAALHASGSLTLQYQFTEAGRYIGLVRARPTVGDEVIAVFPFAVGAGSRQWQGYVAIIVGTVLLTALLFAWATKSRREPT